MQLPHDLIGSGPHKVMVLHGWLGDRTSFGPILPYLDTDTFSYAFVDYRGYGEARDTTGNYTVAEAAQDVLDTADALGWDRFSLIGHSMGGMVAQHVLIAAEQRLEALIGISPVPASGVPFDEQSRQLFTGAAEAPEQRRAILDLTTGNRLPAAWLDAMVHRSTGRTDKTAFRSYLDSWSQTDIHEWVKGRTTPVLVLAGAHDPALSPEVMKDTWLEWYPRAELEIFTDAGHYAPDEVPLALVSHCEGFLRR
ncbi:alpha/beta fold hydrolase [Haloactinomyces albus]|uniref:Pimeloyl-ACP methyl ester carboxylesterase n=1 Tax=Haloactinomyces albus TaxID=1352928 RepID=A0AAE4CM38_9ACTN|nr:alpha/beta hydrolase [Haloactinomyces albus]MDR7302905.1 pimeloyl-ACP methyl ester carboxylesterase [Haloactinomyces albus]